MHKYRLEMVPEEGPSYEALSGAVLLVLTWSGKIVI